MPINSNGKRKAIWNLILNFKSVFLAFILILILSTIVYSISIAHPSINDILRTSWATPWGVVTSLFAHAGFEHYSNNMIGLLEFFSLFIITNLFLSTEEIGKRVSLLLRVVFLMAIVSNFLWIVIAPESSVIGSSGLVYASKGVVTWFALLNGLRIIELPKQNKKDRIWLSLVCLINLLIFGFVFIPIPTQPQVFLNVGAGVNSFVHATSFLGALVLIFLWSMLRQRANK